MFPIITKNRKAISAVLTTIIILVASIVLGTGVVVFSTGLFQTGGQTQSIQVVGLTEWVNSTNSTGIAYGAFAIKNTGDKLLSLSSITVRSVSVPFSSWYVDADPTRVSQNFQAQFNDTTNDKTGFLKGTAASALGYVMAPWAGVGTCTQTFGTTIVIQEIWRSTTASPLCLKQQSGPVSLTPGSSAIVYYKMPLGVFGTTDSGVSGSVSILAGSAPIVQTVRIGNL
ncbi:MAG TPA: hypothetical protein VGR54_07695 [Nitrosopumilaceae archaeon]|nr:hypothetical protein [Nitrosopumilaceae archaeon]